MKRVFVLFMVYCLLLVNLNIPFSSAATDITIESNSPSVITDTNVELSDLNNDTINESLLDPEMMGTVSATESVYEDQPRGRFLVRFNRADAKSSSRSLDGLDVTAFANSLSNGLVDDLDLGQLQFDLGDNYDYQNVKSIDSLNTLYMELTTDEVNRLLTNPMVASIEEDKPIEIAETKLTEVEFQPVKESAQTIPWGIHSIGSYMTQAQKGSGSGAIKVAVFDTGIAIHPDLNIAGGVSFVDSSSNYTDDKGHGTHIAGTIAAIDNGTGVVGAAPAAELYAVKVADAAGTGYTSSVIQGIEWAIDNDIDIINMSFVSSQYSEILHEAIQAAQSSGIIMVAAAGNTGSGESTVQYPAKYPEVVAVGAVDSSHHRLDFSGTGNDLDLVAPGFGIMSTTMNGDYGVSSGTSNSAAHVTGAAALLWAHHPSWSAEEVLLKLYDTATPLGELNEYGKGLVNIAKAEEIISGSIAPLSEENLTGLNTVFPTESDHDIEVASYGKVNNGATISPGDPVTVSLKLEGDQHGANPHEKIIVEVTSASNPNQIIATRTILNPALDVDISYTWQTTTSTPTGTYNIKYRYPAFTSANYDDTFVIYVAQQGVGQDTFEPNDTVYTAKSVVPNQSYVSYVSSSSDIDFYKLTADKTGEITISLSIPSTVDYELSVYDESGNQIGKSSNPTGIEESVTLQVASNKNYFIKVTGFSGQFSPLPYTLTLSPIEAQAFPAPTGLEAVPFSNSIKLSWDTMTDATSYLLRIDGKSVGSNITTTTYTFTNLNPSQGYKLEVAAVYAGGTSKFASIEAATTIPELIIHEPQDIDQGTTSSQLYSFKPATTGVYRFYTSPYKGSGAAVDTKLGIYSSIQLNKQIAENDDANNSVFSEIIVSLVGGETYYVKVQGFDSTPLRARITADVISSTIPYIQLDQPVDINEQSKDSNVYVFIPANNGKYRVTTSKYRGSSSSKNNDTELSVYSDPEMDVPITNGYNDDKRDSQYSEVVLNLSAGTPYYIRVNEVHGGKVYARLLVTSAGQTAYTTLHLGDPINLSKPSGEHAYLQFTPSSSGKYRFFTTNYAGSPELNDTEISLYNDVSLENLIDSNDDAKGFKPYGELFSKLEVNLTAGTTYYLVAKNSTSKAGLQASLIVESMGQASADLAQAIPTDELIESDIHGNPLSISSLYDTDYYKIELSKPEQVNFYLSQGEGAIEDINGNVRGYFSLNKRQVFDLPAGTYYLRIENDTLHNTRESSVWGFTGYTYELTVNINIIEYIPGNYGEASSLRALGIINDTALDATPGSGDLAKVKYKFDKNDTKVYIEVVTAHGGYTVYKTEMSGSFSKNQTIDISWNGIVSPYIDGGSYKNYYANYAEVASGMSQYYAKSGSYILKVYRGNKKNAHEYKLSVFNNPFHELNIIPLPPSTLNGKPILPEDRDKCDACLSYYKSELMTPDGPVGALGYDQWFEELYGMTQYRQVVAGILDLTTCPSNATDLDKLHCTFDALGMVPIIGDTADVVNGFIYVAEGRYIDALWSAGAIIPIVGSFVTPTKRVTYTGVKVFKTIYKINPCGCLPEGTKITTKDGDKPIEAIQVGDLVLAKDTYTGVQAYKPVEKLFNTQSDQIYSLKIGDTTIETTGNHPFWVKDKGWIPADELTPGDQLELESGNTQGIDTITLSNESRQVYNFSVSDFHTYYVSDLGILTHNMNPLCEIKSYSKVKSTLISGSTSKTASKVLEAEITAATGMTKPQNWFAHHLVPIVGDKRFPQTEQIKKILTDAKIDLNSSANGVFLPPNKGVSTAIIDGYTLASHNGGHAQSYYQFVLKTLEEAGGDQKKVLVQLEYIRNELLSGNLAIGNIIK